MVEKKIYYRWMQSNEAFIGGPVHFFLCLHPSSSSQAHSPMHMLCLEKLFAHLQQSCNILNDGSLSSTLNDCAHNH